MQRLYRLTFALVATFLFSSGSVIAGKIEKIASPSGVIINYTKCNRKSGKCMNTAAKHCKGSYQVIDSESHAGGLIADLLPGPVRWYSMTFICGPTDGKMPRFKFQGPDFQMPSIIIPPSINTRCTTYGNTTNCTTY